MSEITSTAHGNYIFIIKRLSGSVPDSLLIYVVITVVEFSVIMGRDLGGIPLWRAGKYG
jgi:hypothetical protein